VGHAAGQRPTDDGDGRNEIDVADLIHFVDEGTNASGVVLGDAQSVNQAVDGCAKWRTEGRKKEGVPSFNELVV